MANQVHALTKAISPPWLHPNWADCNLCALTASLVMMLPNKSMTFWAIYVLLLLLFISILPWGLEVIAMW